MSGAWHAWSWDTDPDALRRDVAVAHERCTGSGRLGAGVRPRDGNTAYRAGPGFSLDAPTGNRFLIRS